MVYFNVMFLVYCRVEDLADTLDGLCAAHPDCWCPAIHFTEDAIERYVEYGLATPGLVHKFPPERLSFMRNGRSQAEYCADLPGYTDDCCIVVTER